MVGFGACARPRREPAHRAARAQGAFGRGQGAGIRPRPGAALDDPAAAGIRDDLVTPRTAPGRLGWKNENIKGRGHPRIRALPRGRTHSRSLVRRQACLVRVGNRLNAFDPESGKKLRSLDVAGHAGTAFDGEHLFQIAENRIHKIDPKTGRVLSSIPAPGGGGDSGLAWAEGTLWVGQYRERKIHQIDPETGAILRTIDSNRFVTGVTWVDGELWHGTWEADESDLRRIDPQTGEVLERVEMSRGVVVSGLESNGSDQFFCGGGNSGKVRAVRRPRRGD